MQAKAPVADTRALFNRPQTEAAAAVLDGTAGEVRPKFPATVLREFAISCRHVAHASIV